MKKTTTQATPKRKAPKASPKARKPSQLEQINSEIERLWIQCRTISEIGKVRYEKTSKRIDAIQSQLASLSQPTVEQAAPQPEGKEYWRLSRVIHEGLGEASVAWSETPKGIFDADKCIAIGKRILAAIKDHVEVEQDRAAVTAKEIGLVPVEWELPSISVGDWVKEGPDNTSQSGHKWPMKVTHVDTGGSRVFTGSMQSWNYRMDYQWVAKLSDSEIAAHLAEQEARANAEKMAKLKAMKPGTPIKVKGKKQCTFIALERECLVWYAHYEDESYYAALTGASDITVIKQP